MILFSFANVILISCCNNKIFQLATFSEELLSNAFVITYYEAKKLACLSDKVTLWPNRKTNSLGTNLENTFFIRIRVFTTFKY
jgi:hypothetical protein